MQWTVLTIEPDEISASLTHGFLESGGVEAVIRPSITTDVIQRRMVANAGAWDVLVAAEKIEAARALLLERPPLRHVAPIDRSGGWMQHFQWIALVFVLLAVLIATII